MTVDEIKQTYSMRDILSRYGLNQPNRSGMCSCPFHKDKQPSMKIYQDGFKCFSCNENGDIIKFVQLVENCSFKDAYLSLGGTYESTKDDFSAKVRLERAKNEVRKRKLAEIRQKQLKLDISNLISFYKSVCAKYEPLTDTWCLAKSNLFYLVYAWEEKYIKGSEVDIGGIISRYSKSNFIGNIVR